MINIRDYEAVETLKDGSTAIIRAIRPDDKATLLKGIDLLSADSRYKRFHGARKGLTEQELKFYTEIDYLHHVALLAVLKDSDQAIGGGRFIVYDTSLSHLSAELAFAVADKFQGLGLATVLFKHLIRIAREVDIHTLEADVLSENMAMIRIFEKGGLPVTKAHEDGNVHVTMTL